MATDAWKVLCVNLVPVVLKVTFEEMYIKWNLFANINYVPSRIVFI